MENLIPKLPGIGKSARLPSAGRSGGANPNKGGLPRLQVKPMIRSFNDFKSVHFSALPGMRIALR